MKKTPAATFLLAAGYLIMIAGFCMPFIALPMNGTKNAFTLALWLGKNGYTITQILLDCCIAATVAGVLLRLIKHTFITDAGIFCISLITLAATYFLLHGLYTNNTNALTKFIGKLANSAVTVKYGLITTAAGLGIAGCGLAVQAVRNLRKRK